MPTSPRIPLLALLALLLTLGPLASAATKRPKAPKLVLTVAQDPARAEPGGSLRLELTLTPPDGVLLNRYPGIRLQLEPAEGVTSAESEVFVGSRTPIEDPDQVYFDQPVPVGLEFVTHRAGPAERRITGKLRYFYCVKKSGYCAPGRQEISVPLAFRAD